MPRKRIIDPEFWSDEEIAHWSFPARLFYIGLWNFADDEGRVKAHPKLLKAEIFPYEKMDVVKLKIEVQKKVIWYEVNGQQYGFIKNFLKHQRIDKPTVSRLPPPILEPPPPRVLQEDSANTPGVLLPKLSKVKLSEVKLSKVKINKEGSPQFTLQQVKDACSKQGLDDCQAELLYATYKKRGWLNGTGQAITDLDACVTNWRLRKPEFDAKLPPKKLKSETPQSYKQRKKAEQRKEYGDFIKSAPAEKLQNILIKSDPYKIGWLIRELRPEIDKTKD